VLTELRIENLGIVENLELVFSDGVIALTGETGAGKTMLVEAINLLIGGRADATVVRHGTQEARVEGRFVVGDNETILCRVVPLDGRSRAYVNGRLATVSQLSELGQELLDMHGQHAHQSLLGAAAQREALDHFAQIDLSGLRAARARVTEVDASLALLGGDERARAREIDLLRFQVDEINAAAIADPQEDEALGKEQDLLSDAVNYRDSLWGAHGVMSDEDGVSDSLGKAIAFLGNRDAFSEIITRMKSIQSDLDDVSGELRDTAEAIEDNPQRLDAVRGRRQLLLDLRRKYGETLSDVMQYGAESSLRLEELEGYEARALALDAERKQSVSELRVQEQRVGEARRKSAPLLAKSVQQRLRKLAMPHAVLDVHVANDSGDASRDAAGDGVVFLLAANPGSEALPLTKVASGGELARTMLALRLVLTEGPHSLVFDEVDAGIGGEAAVAVAQALSDLGKRHQVLVVTHLAQVAAVANSHIQVSKQVRDRQTFAQAMPLDADSRISEIARMLSGGVAETAALEHAKQLLAAAAAEVPAKRSRR
jgi:DNA repair protein RecN (Recombination protein N)